MRPRLRQMERQQRFGVISSSRAWRLAPTSAWRCRSIPSPTPITASSAASDRATPITTSTSGTRCWDQIALCVGSFLPFSITYYLNGHHFIEQQLRNAGTEFRKNDNAFLWVANAQELQAAADALSAKLICAQLDYWTLIVGPKFSKKDRQAVNLCRYYSLQQVEYCRNLIFRRNFPIHKLLERSCDLGLLRLSADRISQVFGWRLHKRIGGKLTRVLERTEHGHHVLRAYAKNAVMRMYEKFSTFLRLEALSNNLKDFGLNKGLDNLDQVRRILCAVTDRFAAFEVQALDVHIDFPLFQRLALPIPCSFASGCAVLWPTASSNAALLKPTSLCLKSKPPTAKPTTPSTRSSNF